MARNAIAILCATAVFAVGVHAGSWTDYGMAQTSSAYESVCWYENLKQFPITNTKDFNKCTGQAESVKKQIKDDAMAKRYFGDWLKQLAMNKLPKEYDSACAQYTKSADAAPAADESDALNDVNSAESYPFKALAYCLMGQLRKKHGDKAIEAVKSERTHSRKHWRTTLLDRDNEFRARHGVEPMKMVNDLNEAAQKWADSNAASCTMEHSDNDDPGRKWRGEGTGESLASGGGGDVKEVNAYRASDGWYQEIKDYPYPDGFDGQDDALFHKIGHFTQSVWKNTKYVGYGYAYNDQCKKWYIAGRYSPPGNFNNDYKANVLPPKD